MSRCCPVTHTRLRICAGYRASSRITGASLTASGRVPKTVKTRSLATALILRHAAACFAHPPGPTGLPRSERAVADAIDTPGLAAYTPRDEAAGLLVFLVWQGMTKLR